jgi:DNA-binding ferritin-like protein (Dps family)
MTMSDAEKGGLISKVIGDKRRWRQYKARVKQLPPNYRATVEAIERYLNYAGGLDVEGAFSLLEDVTELFERAAADGTPIREIVGENPMEFVDALIQNYSEGGYIAKQRERLISDINRAAGEDTGSGRTSR